MIVTDNMKIVFGIGVLLLVIGVGYMYLHQKNTIPIPAVQSVRGTVTSVNAAGLEIALTTTSGEKTIKIDPSTRINKVIVQKNTSSTVDRRWAEEVDIADVQKGDTATVEYRAEKGSTLIFVGTVTLTVYGDADTYIKQAAQLQRTNPNAYLKGKMVLIDAANKKLEFHSYLGNMFSTTTTSIALPDGISVYRVDVSARASIAHAKVPATLAVVKPGNIIALMIDNKAFQAGKLILQAIVISAI